MNTILHQGAMNHQGPKKRRLHALTAFLIIGFLIWFSGHAMAQTIDDLNAEPTPGPDPVNLSIYVNGVGSHPVPNVTPQRLTIYPDMMIALGKAFFWDMQTGSDGKVACATCHFKAGIDDRQRNTIVPGPDGQFQPNVSKNSEVNMANFPYRRFVNNMERGTGGIDPNDPAVVHDFDDVVGAQGVPEVDFARVHEGSAEDSGRFKRGSGQSLNGRNIRQITGRQAPTAINAIFNLVNFWDGRAHNVFNGVDPFGPLNPDARIHEWNGATISPFNMMTPDTVLINSSAASQAVGPPLSDVEMSWKGRSWAKLGRKLLSLQPLAKQVVHPADSIFGELGLVDADGTGLNTTYANMIRQVYNNRFWSAPEPNFVEIDGEQFTLMEANFALFWGLAVQAYESTLVADDTPVDRELRGIAGSLAAFSAQLEAATGIVGLSAETGLGRFNSGGTACANCHAGPELTAASVAALAAPGEAFVEFMPTLTSGAPGTVPGTGLRFYDIGFYNVGMRPVDNDRGRGGLGPNGIPLAFSRHRPGASGLPANFDGTVGGVLDLTPICSQIEAGLVGLDCPPDPAVPAPIVEGTGHDTGEPFGDDGNLAVNGAFKTPHLRNIELTGPYFHSGSMATLMQVVEFYTRGADFRDKNAPFIPIDLVDVIGQLADNGDGANILQRQNVVAFLLALTDDRVRQEAAPFDHPQFFYAEGHVNEIEGHPKTTRTLKDSMVEVPATGRQGRSVQGLPPLRPSFSDQFPEPEDVMFHFRGTE